MTLKLRIVRSLTRLFIILVDLTMTSFSEKMLIFNRCIQGLMTNLIKKSETVSNFRLDTRQFLLFKTYSKKKNACGHNHMLIVSNGFKENKLGLVTKVGY